jgi:hypothetical protein
MGATEPLLIFPLFFHELGDLIRKKDSTKGLKTETENGGKLPLSSPADWKFLRWVADRSSVSISEQNGSSFRPSHPLLGR